MEPRLIIFTVFIAIIVLAVTIWIMRSVRGQGTSADFSTEAAALLGHRMILGDGGDKVIERVFSYNKDLVLVDTNTWIMKVEEPDDVILRWVPNPERGSGGKIMVVRAVDRDGVPAGSKKWRKLLDTMSTFSGESLVMTDRAIGGPLVKSDEIVNGRQVWAASRD